MKLLWMVCLAVVAFRGYFSQPMEPLVSFCILDPFHPGHQHTRRTRRAPGESFRTCLHVFEAFKVVLDVSVPSNQNLERDKPKLLESFACCWEKKKLSMNVSEVTSVRKISVLLQRDCCAAPDRGGTR